MRSKNALRNERFQPFDSDSYLLESNKNACGCKNCCKKFITFLISRVGLMIVMIGYVMAGGIIFETLESDNENKSLRLSESVLEKLVFKIYKQIESNSTRVKDEVFHIFLNEEIKEFITNATINGTLTENSEPQWDFFGSVFYCVTLVSTIGYGHLTCKTKYGKAFTIIYSAIGIPLMMLFLANTGSSTATMFKFIYLKINSMKRRAKFNKLKNNFARTEFEHEVYENEEDNEELSLNQADIILEENTSQPSSKKSSKKSSLKLSLKSFKFKSNTNKNKLKKEDKSKLNSGSTSVTVGIRHVEMPNVLIEKILAGNELSASRSLKTECEKASTTPLIKEADTFDITDALKRINNLIDQNQVQNDTASICSALNLKQVADVVSDESLDEQFNSDSESDENVKGTNLSSSLIPNLFINPMGNVGLTAKPSSLCLDTTAQEKSLPKKEKVKSSSMIERKSCHTPQPEQVSATHLSKSKSEILFLNELKKVQSVEVLDASKAKKNKFKFITKSFMFGGRKKVDSLTNEAVLPKSDEAANLENIQMQPKLLAPKPIRTNGSKQLNRSQSQVTTQSNKPAKLSSIKSAKHMPSYNSKQLQLIYQQYQHEREKRDGVPMLTTLIVMPCYLFCGMLFFSKVEDWKKLDALYFCFVTLTTIGFGDFIPGSTLLNKNGNKKNMYISALYIFVGLILIAMCINLMNKQMKSKVKAVARKIGLSNSTC